MSKKSGSVREKKVRGKKGSGSSVSSKKLGSDVRKSATNAVCAWTLRSKRA